MIIELSPLILFAVLFILLMVGFPVAFTLGGVGLFFGYLTFGADFFHLLPLRVWGIMNNFVLISVPLFVYMGVMLEKSGLAEELLETMAMLFGKLRGGLAISVVLVGTLLAASTGIVGATVVTMGLLSLPTMIKRGYSVELATGTIAASGTLGQIIPPSVVLVLLGSVMNISVGSLFMGAVIPGLVLVSAFLTYIIGMAIFKPGEAPAMPKEEIEKFRSAGMNKKILRALVVPLVLILSVLGTIFAGIASATEAAAVGALGATLLTLFQGKLKLETLKSVMKETTFLTSMVFIILIGATAFGLVFRGVGGDRYLTHLITDAQFGPTEFLIVVMLIIFIAGFFIDFIEITFIIVPVVAPIFIKMGVDPLWLGILIAMNLQTSFLTPPFGFALFYLKGVAPPEVKTMQIYKGVIPFIALQLFVLVMIIIFPEIVTWLPRMME